MTKKQKDMIEKEENMKYIKQFREISIKNVCSDLKINYYNVMRGDASCKKIRRVKEEIERRVDIWLHRYD